MAACATLEVRDMRLDTLEPFLEPGCADPEVGGVRAVALAEVRHALELGLEVLDMSFEIGGPRARLGQLAIEVLDVNLELGDSPLAMPSNLLEVCRVSQQACDVIVLEASAILGHATRDTSGVVLRMRLGISIFGHAVGPRKENAPASDRNRKRGRMS